MAKPTLSTAISQTVEQILAESLHTGLPGKILSFDGKKASVQPLIDRQFTDGDVVTMPVITGVPVVLPSSTNSGIRFKIEPGTTGWISFCERSMDNFLLGGSTTPANSLKFSLSDAVFFPGLKVFNDPTLNNDPEFPTALYDKTSKFAINESGKLFIGNDQAELISLVNQLMTLIISGVPSIATEVTQLQTLLDNIMVSS